MKGLGQEKAYNLLSKKVKVYKITRKEHNLSTFEIESRDEKKIKEIVAGTGVEVQSIGEKGISKKIKDFFCCYGIIAGLVIASMLYFLQYNFVFKIEVWGNKTITTVEVKDYTNKILTSKLKAKINTKDIENKIKRNFNLASSVSVAIIGQSLVVNLCEGVLPPEMEGDFESIKSDYDGLVTDIKLIQGTLNVKVGDVVQKGDILVYPYIIDTDGEKREVKPQAEIMADIWLRGEYCHKDYTIKTQRTGNYEVKSNVFLGNKIIYSQNKILKFQDFEEEKKVEDLVYNNLLPFKVEKTYYYELETVEINKPYEENKEEIIELARQNVLIFLEKNEIIKEEKYFVREGGGCHFIDYVITANRNIGG